MRRCSSPCHRFVALLREPRPARPSVGEYTGEDVFPSPHGKRELDAMENRA